MKPIAICLCWLFSAASVTAHPHIFVETGLELIFDDADHLTHVRVTWQYDELYSLLVTEDMGLDPDYDGVLTAAEIARLTGFDMRWIDGYNGDLDVLVDGEPVPLSGPTAVTARFDAGKITTTHLRAVAAPLITSNDIVLKPYDPTYYTAYDVTLPVTVTGSDACRARVMMPDIDAGLRAVQKQLSALDPMAEPEDAGLPNIGAQLAQDVVVSCSGS